MSITLVTIFPEFFSSPLSCGLMSRARKQGLVDFSFLNPRDFAADKHRSVDDRPYGGGPGMVMLPGPLDGALSALPPKGRKLLMTPKGRPLDQDLVEDLAAESGLVLICGRYEGIDERVREKFDLEPVSVGDFVLNGGEAAALCLIESVARRIPGFMGRPESAGEESFASGLLEYPHYTRPEEFAGRRVPEVLLSGDHGRVAEWRKEKSLQNTLNRRPDLLDRARLTGADVQKLKKLYTRTAARNLYLALIHHPVLNKFAQPGTTSLTNLDIHDIGRVSRTYGLGRYFLCTPVRDQQALARRLLDYWVSGPGGVGNPDRSEALSGIEVVDSLEAAKARVVDLTGMQPAVVGTTARMSDSALTPPELRVRLEDRPVLLVLGTGHGLAPSAMALCDEVLRPLRPAAGYNHMSVRSAASIILDRIIGDFY
ncbi:MAG: tRNA (guanosine(37)-N1)-methyltransferase TrmD [Desulfonatronovibrionaceae bacterium]